MKKFISAILVICLAVFGMTACSKKEDNKSNASASKSKYTAQIVVKDYGTITLELNADVAPITVENFVNLAKSGFYDGLTFHRIKPGFVIQGGDPDANGSGGSKNNIKGEFSANGVNNTISHKRGVISMARSSRGYDTASSQFFICHQDSQFLDGEYAAFGYVTDGMEVVDKICQSVPSGDCLPKDLQPVIEKIVIVD